MPKKQFAGDVKTFVVDWVLTCKETRWPACTARDAIRVASENERGAI